MKLFRNLPNLLFLVKPISKITFLGFLISVSKKSRTIIEKTKCEFEKNEDENLEIIIR